MIIPGMAELAGIVRAHQADTRGTGRLILRCCPSVTEALRAYGGHPEFVPPPGIPAGAGAMWRQVEIHPGDHMPLGGWQLLEDGEVISEGSIGPPEASPEEPA